MITFEYLTDGRLYRRYFNGTTNYEQYDYDPNSGYLYRIWFMAQIARTLVWELTEMDQYKRMTKANIGTTASTWGYDANNYLSSISAPGVHVDSYTYDPLTGNLTYRKNWYQNKEENFGYDQEQLDKLTQVTGPVGMNISYTTDKKGNIQTKSDAGSYVYIASRPYAVDQVTNGQNISTSPQSIRYTAFGKVKQISEDTRTAEFDYNMDQQRVRMVMRNYGSVYKTRYYFGGSCEREVVGSTTTQYIWIGGDAYTAVAVAKKVGTGAWTIYNIFRDHLGTITHLKDATTGTVTEYSFDAWGRRRDANDWTTTLTYEPALFADRGFTGHEYLEEFKLYNMNGRLYDPVVGRFLSPDPFVQDPSNTQNLNRYSYCLNNPLKYTDPSGEIIPWFYFAGQLLGNYLFGVADNTINKKMPMNQAAKQVNLNMSYSPSERRFFMPGADAQMTAWNMETSQRPAYTSTGYWKPVNAYAGAYDDKVYQSTFWKYVPGTDGGVHDISDVGRFPLDKRVDSYLKYPGRFGDPRDGGNRKHAGSDLYAPIGTRVFAVKDGTVIQNPYKFYRNSYAVEIDHGDFVARYSEINVVNGLNKGIMVQQGQLIGYISDLSLNKSMLHFEMYSGNATGPLTNRSNLPFMRRSDLIDPTHFLNFGY